MRRAPRGPDGPRRAALEASNYLLVAGGSCSWLADAGCCRVQFIQRQPATSTSHQPPAVAPWRPLMPLSATQRRHLADRLQEERARALRTLNRAIADHSDAD